MPIICPYCQKSAQLMPKQFAWFCYNHPPLEVLIADMDILDDDIDYTWQTFIHTLPNGKKCALQFHVAFEEMNFFYEIPDGGFTEPTKIPFQKLTPEKAILLMERLVKIMLFT